MSSPDGSAPEDKAPSPNMGSLDLSRGPWSLLLSKERLWFPAGPWNSNKPTPPSPGARRHPSSRHHRACLPPRGPSPWFLSALPPGPVWHGALLLHCGYAELVSCPQPQPSSTMCRVLGFGCPQTRGWEVPPHQPGKSEAIRAGRIPRGFSTGALTKHLAYRGGPGARPLHREPSLSHVQARSLPRHPEKTGILERRHFRSWRSWHSRRSRGGPRHSPSGWPASKSRRSGKGRAHSGVVSCGPPPSPATCPRTGTSPQSCKVIMSGPTTAEITRTCREAQACEAAASPAFLGARLFVKHVFLLHNNPTRQTPSPL